LRSSIIKDATTTVLLSPATKQALGLRAQIEGIHASSADSDIHDPDIFKARVCFKNTLIRDLTHFFQGNLFSETDGDADSRYERQQNWRAARLKNSSCNLTTIMQE
jgi:hypothetical protein